MTLTHKARYEKHGEYSYDVWCECGWPDDKPVIAGDRGYVMRAFAAHVDATSQDVGAMAVIVWMMLAFAGAACGIAIGFAIDRFIAR